MASLVKNLRLLSNITSAIRTNTSQRTLFAPALLGVDGFKKQQEKSELLAVNNIEPFKKRLEQTLNENKPLFTEDLKTMLYLTRNDADLSLLIQALKKYKSQSLSITDFNFGSPLMRLLYVMNKTDEALKFYVDPELQHIFDNEFTSLILLLNKLNESKRYSDTVKTFFTAVETKKKFKDPATNKFTFPNDSIKLVSEALYHINDKQAIEDMKKLWKLLSNSTSTSQTSPTLVVNSILLALNQNENDLAFEMLMKFVNQQGSFYLNLKAVTLARNTRFNESFSEIEKILESRSTFGTPVLVYPLTMKLIREDVEKSGDKQIKEQLETLSKKVISLNRLANKDLTEMTLGLIETRAGPRRQQDDRFNQQYSGDGYRRFNRSNFGDGGNEGRFNRSNFGNGERRPFQNRGPPRTGEGFSLNRQNFNNEGSNFERQQGGFNRPPRTFQREQGQQTGNRTPNRSTRPQNDDDE